VPQPRQQVLNTQPDGYQKGGLTDDPAKELPHSLIALFALERLLEEIKQTWERQRQQQPADSMKNRHHGAYRLPDAQQVKVDRSGFIV